jgi:hypothetical protein
MVIASGTKMMTTPRIRFERIISDLRMPRSAQTPAGKVRMRNGANSAARRNPICWAVACRLRAASNGIAKAVTCEPSVEIDWPTQKYPNERLIRKIGRLTGQGTTDSSRFFTSECRTYPPARRRETKPVWPWPLPTLFFRLRLPWAIPDNFSFANFLVFCTKIFPNPMATPSSIRSGGN